MSVSGAQSVKMETDTLVFPLSLFPCISQSLCLSLGDSEVSACVCAPAQLSKVYGHFGLRYIQEVLSPSLYIVKFNYDRSIFQIFRCSRE